MVLNKYAHQKYKIHVLPELVNWLEHVHVHEYIWLLFSFGTGCSQTTVLQI